MSFVRHTAMSVFFLACLSSSALAQTGTQACGGDLGRERLAAYSKDARAIYRNMARRLLAKYAG